MSYIYCFFCLIVGFAASTSNAMFEIPQLKEVPVERMISNLESRIKKIESSPKPDVSQKANLTSALARLHSMAYALKIEVVSAATYGHSRDKEPLPDYREHIKGEGTTTEPHRYFPEVIKSSNPAAEDRAKKHLAKAIKLYRQAVESGHGGYISLLGLAWCLEQNGQIEEAKTHYRMMMSREMASLSKEGVTDQLLFFLRTPYTDGGYYIEFLKMGKPHFRLNLFSTSFLSLIGENSLSNGFPFNDSEKKKIRTLANLIDGAIRKDRIADLKLNFEKLRKVVNKAEDRVFAKDENKNRFPKKGYVIDELENLLALIEGKGSRPGFSNHIIASFTASKTANVVLTPGTLKIQKVKSETGAKQQTEFSTFGPEERDGEPIKYVINTISKDGKILSSIEREIKTERSFEKIEPPPSSFTIKDQFERQGIGEATYYLSRLLDPVKDAAELEHMRKLLWVGEKKRIRAITPIAIPLKDGLGEDDIRDSHNVVKFDLDGSGASQKWEWISPNAGWLVYIPAGKNINNIDSGLRLFGSVSFWIFWNSGYDALCALDNDGDDMLKSSELNNLAIWRDSNRNGVSELGEVRDLSYWKINQIQCAYGKSPTGTDWNPSGVTFSNGRSRPTFDIILRSKL